MLFTSLASKSIADIAEAPKKKTIPVFISNERYNKIRKIWFDFCVAHPHFELSFSPSPYLTLPYLIFKIE